MAGAWMLNKLVSIRRVIRSRVARIFKQEIDQELSQQIVRLFLTVLLTGYFHITMAIVGTDPSERIIIIVTTFVLGVHSIFLMLWKRFKPGLSHARRMEGMIADYTGLGLVISLLGPASLPAYAAVLWVTVGNGLRYGPRYLMIALTMSTITVSVGWAANPYWKANPFMAATLLITAIALPLYVSSLIVAYTKAENELKKANTAKNRFMAQMSHEFRTPLNGIMGMSQLMATDNIPKEHKESAELIYSSAKSLLFMVEDVLDISAIEAGKVKIETRNFNIHGLLRRIEQVVDVQARAARLELSLTVDPLVPQIVHGDPEHLNQVLLNLMNNAVKFTKKGSVRLTVSPMTFKTASVLMRFSVRDTGVGIPSDSRERIFEAFEQVESGFNRQHGGIGLGISIAKTLTQTMGGTIGMDSNPGGGSHFWVDLELGLVKPLADSIRKESGDHGVSIVSFDNPFIRHRIAVKQLHVLVVDDQMANKLVLQKMLERAGHIVSFADDGESALDAILEIQPDLIALDLHMPGMNGIDVLKQLRVMEAGNTRKTPVIMISADATKEAIKAMEESSATACLSKPIMANQLLDTIAKVVALSEGKGHKRSSDATEYSQPSPRDSLVDLVNIDSDPAFLHGYIEQAFDDIRSSIAQLESQVFRIDIRRLRAVLHAIRGVARNISAEALAGQCKAYMEMEDKALGEQVRSIASVLTTMADEAKAHASARIDELITESARRGAQD